MAKKKITKEKVVKAVKSTAKKAKTVAKPVVEKAIEVVEPEVKSLWQKAKAWVLKLVG